MRRKYALLALVFGLVVVCDQATKYLAVSRLTNVLELNDRRTLVERVGGFLTLKNLDNEPARRDGVDHRKGAVVVVPGFWNHKYVENPGAAWGLLSKVDDRWRVPFFHVISLLAIGIILAFYRRLEADQRVMAFALSLVLGGAVGNYLDRLARSYVIDFIDWHWRGRSDLHWPTFNVADAAICVGVVLMLGETLFGRRLLIEPATAPAPGPAAAPPNPDSLPSAEPSPPSPQAPSTQLPSDEGHKA
ncbi:MAG: signal peptidase II [Deltaproteobacteria bacterium]|nr:signal peptidase II [Deltaproteobacteria bacterium]